MTHMGWRAVKPINQSIKISQYFNYTFFWFESFNLTFKKLKKCYQKL